MKDCQQESMQPTCSRRLAPRFRSQILVSTMGTWDSKIEALFTSAISAIFTVSLKLSSFDLDKIVGKKGWHLKG